MTDAKLLQEWMEDALGPVWTGLLLLLLPIPLYIAVVDLPLGVVSLVYSLFWLWRLVVSYRIYRAARLAGKSRESWLAEEIEAERRAAAEARERMEILLKTHQRKWRFLYWTRTRR